MSKIVDPRAEALEYMNKNKVKILFDILGSKLAKEKPANPNEYLLTELLKIQEQKAVNKPVCLFALYFYAAILLTANIWVRWLYFQKKMYKCFLELLI